jgi:hypothetical protein
MHKQRLAQTNPQMAQQLEQSAEMMTANGGNMGGPGTEEGIAA